VALIGEQQDLERPGGPPWNNSNPMSILEDQTSVMLEYSDLNMSIFAKEARLP